jgi:cobalt/nickel transport system ATP-binding protein
LIEVEHVSIVYPGGVRALEDATFHVAPGECVALAGANGAGKSTLLLALLGLIPAESGVIRVGGITLSARTAGEIRKKAGLLFQNPDDQLFSPRVYDDVAFA